MTEKEWKASALKMTVRDAGECVERKRTLRKLLGSKAAVPAPLVSRRYAGRGV
jgi:hypothetical protein